MPSRRSAVIPRKQKSRKMSAALKQLSKLRVLLSPSFYKTQYLQMCERYHHQYITKGR